MGCPDGWPLPFKEKRKNKWGRDMKRESKRDGEIMRGNIIGMEQGWKKK